MFIPSWEIVRAGRDALREHIKALAVLQVEQKKICRKPHTPDTPLMQSRVAMRRVEITAALTIYARKRGRNEMLYTGRRYSDGVYARYLHSAEKIFDEAGAAVVTAGVGV
jgi:hypothetical protein